MKNNAKLSNGKSFDQMTIEEMRAEMLHLFKQHPAKGLYLRLVDQGLEVREVSFLEAKKGRTGFEKTMKILTALRQLPTTEQALNRIKLTAK